MLALGTAVGLTLARDWRVLLLLLGGEYALLAVSYTTFLPLHLAYVKFVVGLFVVLILLVTMWQIQGRAPASQTSARLSSAFQLGLLMLITALTGVVAWLVGRGEEASFTLAFGLRWLTYSLLGLGLLRFLTSNTAVRLGIGLLLLLSGIELFYLSWNPSWLMLGFFALATLGSTLAIAYLIQWQLLSSNNQSFNNN